MADTNTPNKATGSGTKASISTDGSTYKEFASITKIGPPSMSRGTVDVTDMNSYENNDQMKEFLTDFIEADEMTIPKAVFEGYAQCGKIRFVPYNLNNELVGTNLVFID